MKKTSISIKITLAFLLVSVVTLLGLYFVFFYLFEQHMLEVEKDKAALIAQTIEPMIGMNHYLGMNEEIANIGQQIIKHKQVVGLAVTMGGEILWSSVENDSRDHIHVSYPIEDPVTSMVIGAIDLSYTMDSYNNAINDVKETLLYYFGMLSLVFALFAMFSRYSLSPLSKIATIVQRYQLGSDIDFSNVRLETETGAITDAFQRMVANIREYTVLLERYKHSVDESSIVSRTDLEGRITYVNDEFCRVSGYSRDELIGQKHFLIRHPDTPDSTYAELWATIKANRIWKSTLKNRRKDGSAYYVKATIVPILDESDAVIEYMGIQHDITQIIEQQERILRQATDMITGLPNRVKLEEDLKTVVSPKFAILNIDNYQIIKDYYGYDVGNQALQEVARILQAFLKNHNVTAYKLASGEFGLLAGDETIDIDFFYLICQHIVQKIEEHTVNILDNSFDFSVSIGVTHDERHLLTYAGLALKHAQDTRKSTILYESTENLIYHYENNLVWTKKIKLALKENRITVFVQPILSANELRVEKYECLVRMIDEDDNIISPFHFLEIAKQSKLYHQITRQVIDVSFAAFSKIDDVQFSINLTVDDLLHRETMEFLIKKITESSLASRLVLEIVESEGIETFVEISDAIHQFKKLGCKIAIDDFGTGYSNFSYLMQLNIDVIKIDGSLIKTIDTDKRSQIISTTIIDFSRQLELSTVAEFVHNESVLDYVRSIGIDYVQGYHLGEPVPIDVLLTDSIASN